MNNNKNDLTDVMDEVQFKEYELKRRIGLKAISSHKISSSPEPENIAKSARNALGLIHPTHLSTDSDRDDHVMRKESRILKEGAAGRNILQALLPEISTPQSTASPITRHRKLTENNSSNSNLTRNNMTDEQKQKMNEQNNAPHQIHSQQELKWFNKMFQLDGVTDAEALIVQSEMMHNETQLMKMWSREAQRLVTLKADESRLKDEKEMEDLIELSNELDKESEKMELEMAVIAAIINKKEREKCIAALKGKRILKEQKILTSILNRGRVLVDDIYLRSCQRETDLRNTFSEGPMLLIRFGGLLDKACENLISNHKRDLLTILHQKGINTGRIKSTDAANKLHRKITLNPLDMTPDMSLANGDLTVLHMDEVSLTPKWGMVRCTEGPWSVRRYDRPLVKDVVNDAILTLKSDLNIDANALDFREQYKILQDEINSIANASSTYSLNDAVRTLARVLDAVHPGAMRIHGKVVANETKGIDLLQKRLDALGFTFSSGSGSLKRIHRTHKKENMKLAVLEVLTKIDKRLGFYGRFYFEFHPHASDSSNVGGSYSRADKLDYDNNKNSNIKNKTKWAVGWTFSPLTPSDYPGSDEFSFGFMWDGTMWHDGESYQYTKPLLDATVIGLLADLNAGTLTLYADENIV